MYTIGSFRWEKYIDDDGWCNLIHTVIYNRTDCNGCVPMSPMILWKIDSPGKHIKDKKKTWENVNWVCQIAIYTRSNKLDLNLHRIYSWNILVPVFDAVQTLLALICIIKYLPLAIFLFNKIICMLRWCQYISEIHNMCATVDPNQMLMNFTALRNGSRESGRGELVSPCFMTTQIFRRKFMC